jgi:hypothetical protein
MGRPTPLDDEVRRLFEALVRELHDGGYLLALGAESWSAPYFQILSPPERRSLSPQVGPETRTVVRVYPSRAYFSYLENSFPRLYDRLREACHPGRPFLVVERWLPYVDLGNRLLRFTRDRGLNLRCVDYASGESRLNGVRVHFDPASHRWRVEDGAVDELLRDPRRRSRSWLSALNPRWSLTRMAGRLGVGGRGAGPLAQP